MTLRVADYTDKARIVDLKPGLDHRQRVEVEWYESSEHLNELHAVGKQEKDSK